MTAFFFSFSGRIANWPYLLGFVFLLVIRVLLTIGLIKIYGLELADYLSKDTAVYLEVEAIVNGLLFWPLLALGYKRLHDLGLSGKVFGLSCLFYLLVVFFGSQGLPDQPMQSIWFLFALLISFSIRACFIIYLIYQPGEEQVNRYGPPPSALID